MSHEKNGNVLTATRSGVLRHRERPDTTRVLLEPLFDADAADEEQNLIPPDEPDWCGDMGEADDECLSSQINQGVEEQLPQARERNTAGNRDAKIGTPGSWAQDERWVGQPVTAEQKQAVDRELEAAKAEKLSREGEAALTIVENEAEEDACDWSDYDDPDEYGTVQPALSPVEQATNRMLERIDGNVDDDERLFACCIIVLGMINLDHDEWSAHQAIDAYAKLRPFARSRNWEEVDKILADARRQKEVFEAAEAVGVVYPSELLAGGAANGWLVPGVIPAAQVGTISAPKNGLKTKTSLDLQLSLATGTKFLNQWAVTGPVRSCMIAGEDSPFDVDDAIKRICASKNIDPKSLDGQFFYTTRLPRPRSKDWLSKWRRFIERVRLESLGIDASYLTLGGADQRSLQAMGDALAPLKQLVDDTGCAIELGLHHKRASGSRWPLLNDIAGVGFEELSRYWVILNRRREWDPATGQHWLRLVVGNKQREDRYHLDVREGHVDDPGGRVWEPVVRKPGKDAADGQPERSGPKHQPATRLGKYKQSVLTALATDMGGLSKTAMCDEAGVPEKHRKKVIDALLASKEIAECKIQVGNQKTPIPGYRLRQPS